MSHQTDVNPLMQTELFDLTWELIVDTVDRLLLRQSPRSLAMRSDRGVQSSVEEASADLLSNQ